METQIRSKGNWIQVNKEQCQTLIPRTNQHVEEVNQLIEVAQYWIDDQVTNHWVVRTYWQQHDWVWNPNAEQYQVIKAPNVTFEKTNHWTSVTKLFR